MVAMNPQTRCRIKTELRENFDSTYHLIGARFYDPTLGLWLSPDAARQYHSPYAFGPNPIMGVDKDGNWFGLDDAIVFVVGAGTSYIQNGIQSGEWFTGDAFNSMWIGGTAGVVGYNTTIATGGNIYAGAAAAGATSGGLNYLVGDQKNKSFGGLVLNSFAGAAGGLASAGVGQAFGADNLLADYAGQTLGGYAGGFTSTAISTGGNWKAANEAGLWGGAFGAGSVTLQPLNNRLAGLGWRFNSEINQFANNAAIRRAEAEAYGENPEQWAKDGSIQRGSEKLKGSFKCAKFCAVTANAKENNANLQANISPIKPTVNEVRDGDIMYLRSGDNPKGGSLGGHAMVIGRNGDYIHASNALGGAVVTQSWGRAIYRGYYFSDVEVTFGRW